MNEKQAFSTIKNTIKLENLSSETVRKILPGLRASFDEITRMIDALPPDDIARQIRYQQMQQRLGSILAGTNDQFKAELSATLRKEVEDQAKFAQSYLDLAEVSPAQQVAASSPQQGLQVGVGTGQTPTFQSLGPEITRTQLMALADDSKVLGQTLDKLFSSDGTNSLSPWLKSNIQQIDRVVKTGFLTGQTNEEIAKGLRVAEKLTRTQAQAVARTAVMDMSQRAHERMWDANKSRIAGWEFDASMDNRVCPECAPFDGRTAKERSELPSTPVHVNCRCAVLPLTRTELALREEEGPQRRTVIELVDAPSKEAAEKIAKNKFGATRSKAYAKQVRGPDGKKYWRVASDVTRKDHPLTMGEFVKEASPATQKQILGASGSKRFNKLISPSKGNKGAMTPDAALAEVTKGVRKEFKPGTRSALQSPAVKGTTIKKAPKPAPKPKPPVKAKPVPKPAAPRSKREGPPTVDVSQMRRAASGGEYGPDGHFYPGGSFMPDGNFVGQKQPLGKGDRPVIKAADQVKPADAEPRVVRQRENKAPRPYVPSSATGLETPANKLSKLQQRRQSEFFDKQGFLSEDIAIAARKAGPDGRSPIDNTNFISVLANRADRNWLESKIKDIRRVITDKNAFDYAMEDSDFISQMEFAGLTRGMSAVDEGHWAAARRLQQAVFELAGQRVAKKKGSRRARHHNEEMIWIMNNVFMTKRRG